MYNVSTVFFNKFTFRYITYIFTHFRCDRVYKIEEKVLFAYAHNMIVNKIELSKSTATKAQRASPAKA